LIHFAGMVHVALTTSFPGEIGMVAVVTDDYGYIKNPITVNEAFDKLATFLRRFIDSQTFE